MPVVQSLITSYLWFNNTYERYIRIYAKQTSLRQSRMQTIGVGKIGRELRTDQWSCTSWFPTQVSKIRKPNFAGGKSSFGLSHRSPNLEKWFKLRVWISAKKKLDGMPVWPEKNRQMSTKIAQKWLESLEKLKILTPSQKLPKAVRDLGKLIVAKGFKKLPKVK